MRWVVASKRKLSNSLFERLVADADDSVRERLAHNMKIPKHLLERLAQDENAEVARAAQERLS